MTAPRGPQPSVDKDDKYDSDDTLLAAALTDGGQPAFERLLRRHRPAVLAVLRRVSRDRSAAEDLAQQACLVAWQKRHQCQGGGRFRAWLLRIGWREFLQAARRERREPVLFEPAERLEALTPVDPEAVAPAQQPGIDTLLACCTGAQQQALYMAYVLEFTQEQIAGVMGVPLGTVKSHIQRGKARIRQSLTAVEVVQ